MKVGSRVTLTLNISARSTDPLSGERCDGDCFRVIKKGTRGLIEAVKGDFVIVRLDGVTTRQELRADCLKEVR